MGFCRSAPNRDAVQNVREDVRLYQQFQQFASKMVAESVKRHQKGVALSDNMSDVEFPRHAWVNGHSKQPDGRRGLHGHARYRYLKVFGVFEGMTCADNGKVRFGRVHF